MDAVGEVCVTKLEHIQRIAHRHLPVKEEVACFQDPRHRIDDLDFLEAETAAKDPLAFKQDSHRNEEWLALLDIPFTQTIHSFALPLIVLNDAPDQDVRVYGSHQRNGFMSSIDTVLPLRGFSIPIKSSNVLVFART